MVLTRLLLIIETLFRRIIDAQTKVYHDAVAAWLESRLQAPTQARYLAARNAFAAWVGARGFTLSELSWEEIDVFAARFIVEAVEDEDCDTGRQFYVDLMAALQKRSPIRLTLGKKVLSAWASLSPPQQAQALPREAAFAAAVVMCLLWEMHEEAIVTVLGFCGLLRIGEACNLLDECVHVGDVLTSVVVLVLGTTKRGFEERVVLNNPQIAQWVRNYLKIR